MSNYTERVDATVDPELYAQILAVKDVAAVANSKVRSLRQEMVNTTCSSSRHTCKTYAR